MLRAHQTVYLQLKEGVEFSPCAEFYAPTVDVLRAVDKALSAADYKHYGSWHPGRLLAAVCASLPAGALVNWESQISRDSTDARSDEAVVVVDLTNKKVVVDEMYHKMPFPPVSEYTWEQVNLDEDRREHHGITPDQDPVW